MAFKGLTALREDSRLSVEVSDLLRHPGTSQDLSFTEEVAGMRLAMGKVRPMLALKLLLESLVEGILASGEVRGAYDLECIRCLKRFEQPFSVPLSELLTYEGQPLAEDGYQLDGTVAHLEPIVRDAVLLAMPANPLCRPDCKGLCPVCGADRNATDCGHRPERVDLRWEPLQVLKEQMGPGE